MIIIEKQCKYGNLPEEMLRSLQSSKKKIFNVTARSRPDTSKNDDMDQTKRKGKDTQQEQMLTQTNDPKEMIPK